MMRLQVHAYPQREYRSSSGSATTEAAEQNKKAEKSTLQSIMARWGCPGQARPCRRSVRRLVQGVAERSHWLLFFCIISTIIYLLAESWSSSSLNLALSPFPASPHWATVEERALLQESLDKWHFSAGMCIGCSTYRYRRVIRPSSSICSATNGKDPELLVLVSTIHRNKKYRCLIRNTWGTYTEQNKGRVRLLFLFGKDPSGNATEEQLLQEEGAALGDILQDDFNSTYRRGGEIQLIMGYHWVVEECSNIKHVLKVSDDTFVNIPKVLELIARVNLSNSLWGQCWNLSFPCRDREHKWYVSREEWPADLYPKYCAGAYLGTTVDVIRKLLLVAPYVAWSAGNDDVLMGMCAEKLGIPMKDIGGFFVWERNNPCRMKGPKYALHFHGSPPEILIYFWSRRECFEGRKGLGHVITKKTW